MKGPTGATIGPAIDVTAEPLLASVVRRLAARRGLEEHAEELAWLLAVAGAGDAYPHRRALDDALALALHANHRGRKS